MNNKELNVSRRDFLKGAGVTAAGAAALSLAGCASQAAPASASASAETSAADAAEASSASAASAAPTEASASTAEPVGASTAAGYPLGGPDNENTAPFPPADVPDAWDDEADFIVVGSGAGGLACADYLQQNGVSVILVEKQDQTGGASRYAGGVANIFGGAETQNIYGIAWPEYPSNLEAFTAAYEAAHQWSVDQGLIKTMAYASGPAIDWTLEHEGLEWMASPSGYCDMDMILGKQTGLMGMNNTIEAYDKSFQDNGGKEYLRTRVIALVMDGGTVVGVQAEQSTESGTETIFLKGEKGVALCTGGFGMNRDMIKKYTPSAYEGIAQGGPMPGNEGDGLRLGLGVGADIAGYDSWSGWEAGIDEETNGGDGSFWHYFWHGERQVFHNPWCLINKNGERVPYYSNGVQGFRFEPSIQMGDMQNCAAWVSQPGGRVYNICDSTFAEHVFDFQQSDFFVDASRIPITPDMPLLEVGMCSNDWQEDFDKAVERGAVKKADTLDELAEMLTLDPDVLKDAVAHYNEICEAGEDTEMYPPYDPSWLHAVKEPPFYGVIMSAQMAKTGCGLRVNEKLEVVDAAKRPIPGLYANCWTAGGFIGEGNFGGYWNGAMNGGVGSSLVSGFVIAQTILGEENEDPAINQRENFANPEPFPELGDDAAF